MKLRAYLCFDFDAADFAEAAAQQECIKRIADNIAKHGYKNVTYEVKERRDVKGGRRRKELGN